ncbi:zinc ribbon domain-containing protein [Streptomyces sp. NPDC001985]|uniref:zinc-ribbon domain-containing protein n=1 Tax=Streptomyces sp. NPDC001985 TaxID=3154406 RepID=UPI00333201D1
MIIFGTKGYLHQLAILTFVCGFCGNPAAHTLRKRVTKFTLFFVPLIPLSTKFQTQCTFCGAERKVSREEADALLAQSTAGPGISGPQGPQGPGGGQPYGGPRQQGRNPYQH